MSEILEFSEENLIENDGSIKYKDSKGFFEVEFWRGQKPEPGLSITELSWIEGHGNGYRYFNYIKSLLQDRSNRTGNVIRLEIEGFTPDGLSFAMNLRDYKSEPLRREESRVNSDTTVYVMDFEPQYSSDG